MTGRSLHDALLRALTSAELRGRLGDGAPGISLGREEVETLGRADTERLRRLARFMGRHFYRERIVRLFAASRRLARERARDPLAILETPAFDALLEAAEIGSAGTAESVASLVEAELRETLGEQAHARDVVAYEGVLFRVEAGPRRWHDSDRVGDAPARAPTARLIALEWDVTGLVAAARRGDAVLPIPTRSPTRLLTTLTSDGRVTTIRSSDALERLFDALDGHRPPAEIAARVGVAEADAARLLRQLTAVGAVVWPPRS